MKRSGPLALALGCLACGLAGCDPGSGPPPVSRGTLPPGVVARVGEQLVTAAEVARIAGAQRLDAAQARDVAVHDALLAGGAAARGLSESPGARLSWEGELARRMLRRVLAEARATPPTEAELQAAAARRWLEVDRPEGFRTVHAVVGFDGDETKKARARAVAAAIRAAVAPIAEHAATMPLPEGAPPPNARMAPKDDPDPLSAAFRQVVQRVTARDGAGLQIKAEPLPAVTAAGRLLVPGDEHLDEGFSLAAATLPARGSLSPVIESSFGVHVIMLLERTPAIALQGDARLARLRDDIVNERARAAEKRLLAGLRERRSVAPDAAALLALVSVDQ